jgi:hypothetical protein
MADRYAGIDWATEKHDVLVADESGSAVLTATFVHDKNGLSCPVPHPGAAGCRAGRYRAA